MSHLYFLGVLGWKGSWDVYLMPVKRECYAWTTALYICPRFWCENSMLCICHFWPKLLKKGLPLSCTHNIMPHSTNLECRYLPDALVLSCFSCVWLFVTQWTSGHQAILYSGFSRQENWSGLPFPSPKKGMNMSKILPSQQIIIFFHLPLNYYLSAQISFTCNHNTVALSIKIWTDIKK